METAVTQCACCKATVREPARTVRYYLGRRLVMMFHWKCFRSLPDLIPKRYWPK